MTRTPALDGYRQPAEWDRHDACWVAWPSHEDLWLDGLPAARDEFIGLCQAIHARGKGELLNVLVPDEKQETLARKALGSVTASYHRIPFGDIWLRDTAPVFVHREGGDVAAVRFAFNGWGGKYVLDHDAEVSASVAEASRLPTYSFPWVLEGGSIDVDGEGTCLTTRQCLLNPNRNPSLRQGEIESGIREALGIEAFVWLGDGLVNDHTDGHVDTIARFVAPGVVVCMEPRGGDDPNRDVLVAIASSLAEARDARGRRLEIVRIPSPGRIESDDGRVMPASYVNFYIGNARVVVPTYGVAGDDEAVRRIAALFPGRETFGVSARAILTGGGAFHCITQQQPASGRRA
jgi:agmatine deiminase